MLRTAGCQPRWKMQRNPKATNGAVLTICLLSAILAGCPREWRLAVTDLGDPSHPGLCVSQYRNCEGSGIPFSSFVIAEVNEQGRYVLHGKLIKPMWIIEPVKNVSLREIKYGKVPEGWREIKAAVPLEFGKFYSANDRYFRIVKVNNQAKAEVLTDREFLHKYYKP